MNLKDNYSNAEWEQRKKYYIDNSIQIAIPTEATLTELKSLIALNNNLLTEAYYDKSIIFEKHLREERRLKLMEEEGWCSIDWNNLDNKKLIKEEKKSYITKYITNTTKEQEGMALQDKVSLLASRAAFIESVVYNLKDKAQALSNLLALLKIEYDQIKYENHVGNMK